MNRHVFLLIPTVLLTLVACGCGPRQRDIEKSIRDEMKSKMSVDITSFDLKKQADGSFAGTATAQNGDVYDVSTKPVKDNKVEWMAIPGQGMMENTVRQELEKRTSSKVKSLQLTKSAPGVYSGTAEMASGPKLTVKTHTQGTQVMLEFKPMTP